VAENKNKDNGQESIGATEDPFANADHLVAV
jgi:hypothetical protein